MIFGRIIFNEKFRLLILQFSGIISTIVGIFCDRLVLIIKYLFIRIKSYFAAKILNHRMRIVKRKLAKAGYSVNEKGEIIDRETGEILKTN